MASSWCADNVEPEGRGRGRWWQMDASRWGVVELKILFFNIAVTIQSSTTLLPSVNTIAPVMFCPWHHGMFWRQSCILLLYGCDSDDEPIPRNIRCTSSFSLDRVILCIHLRQRQETEWSRDRMMNGLYCFNEIGIVKRSMSYFIFIVDINSASLANTSDRTQRVGLCTWILRLKR